MSPIDVIKNLLGRGHNPENMVQMLSKNNPQISNLVSMAKKGDITTFAKNICAERGINFEQEFNKFMSNFK